MYAILKKEFKFMFKSIKSIGIILLFIFMAYLMAKFGKNNPALLQNIDKESNPYLAGIRMLVVFFGFLFVLTLSHDTINKEVESQTMRFLVTKISKTSIVVGKYLGILLFWSCCIGISVIVVTCIVKKIFFYEFFKLMAFIAYVVGLNILISTVISKQTYSMFATLIIGVIAPGIGIWSMFSDNKIILIIKYLSPYYYIMQSGWLSFIPCFFSIIMLIFSIFIFRRKDL